MAGEAAGGAAPYRLKDSFGPEVPARIAQWLRAADPAFDSDGFLAAVRPGYDDLELMPRARHIADALARFLPADREQAVRLIRASLPPLAESAAWRGMEAFRLLPYVVFVGQYGLDCFDASMELQVELTKRFTAEFSIREFIVHRYEPTMARLAQWAGDDSEHVRRLVSEGTRPRLPWAPRLRRFIDDPRPVLPLLERLKDDPSEYVRRSVANNLNDIAKDHPGLVLAVAREWLAPGAPAQRRALIRHALRTLVKRGDPQALALLGFTASDGLRLTSCVIEPARAAIGQRVRIGATVTNEGDHDAFVLVDLAVDFVKASGAVTRKVFKGAELVLAPGESRTVTKSVSLAQHTTRTHYPGVHRVWVQVNGRVIAGGTFELRAADTPATAG